MSIAGIAIMSIIDPISLHKSETKLFINPLYHTMPFKSLAQKRYLFATHPDMALRWAKETPKNAHLPQHVRKKKKKYV